MSENNEIYSSVIPVTGSNEDWIRAFLLIQAGDLEKFKEIDQSLVKIIHIV